MVLYDLFYIIVCKNSSIDSFFLVVLLVVPGLCLSFDFRLHHSHAYLRHRRTSPLHPHNEESFKVPKPKITSSFLSSVLEPWHNPLSILTLGVYFRHESSGAGTTLLLTFCRLSIHLPYLTRDSIFFNRGPWNIGVWWEFPKLQIWIWETTRFLMVQFCKHIFHQCPTITRTSKTVFVLFWEFTCLVDGTGVS